MFVLANARSSLSNTSKFCTYIKTNHYKLFIIVCDHELFFPVGIWTSMTSYILINQACNYSYKEESDDVTESDDLIEIEMTEADQEKETAETVEKVVRHRTGRKGG
jgi:hypothetical protein